MQVDILFQGYSYGIEYLVHTSCSNICLIRDDILLSFDIVLFFLIYILLFQPFYFEEVMYEMLNYALVMLLLLLLFCS